MMNLIPKEEKKRMATDFYLRFAVLLLLLLSFCVFVATIALLPAYFLSSKKDSVISAKLAVQKNEPLSISGEQSLSTIQDMNTKLGMVENAEKNKFLISQKVINAIILKKSPQIKITQISYQNDVTQGKRVTIVGVAPSRQALLLFSQALQDDPAFKNINLPISNFVKQSDLEFDLTLIPS